MGSNERGARELVSCIRGNNLFLYVTEQFQPRRRVPPVFPGSPGAARHCRGRFFQAVADSNRNHPGGAGRLRYSRTGADRNGQNGCLRAADYRAFARRAAAGAARSHPGSDSGAGDADSQRFRKAGQVYAPQGHHGLSEASRSARKFVPCAINRISSLRVRGACWTYSSRGKAMLAQIKILVLDEADQMFDMGFLPDIQSIPGETAGPAAEPFVRRLRCRTKFAYWRIGSWTTRMSLNWRTPSPPRRSNTRFIASRRIARSICSSTCSRATSSPPVSFFCEPSIVRGD